MSVEYLGSLTVADVFPPIANLALTLDVNLKAVFDLLLTLEGGLDFLINFEFGLPALKFSVMLEFQAAINASLSISLAISNPLAQISLSISALMQALVSLQASLALGLPTVSADLSLQLNCVLAVALAASAKMAGIQIAIDILLSLLSPILNIRLMLEGIMDLALQFTAVLPNPGVYLYAGETPFSTFEPSLGPPPAGLTSGTNVGAIVMMADPGSQPATWGALQFLVKTTP